MVYNERTEREQAIAEAAREIMTAARTAPKAKGIDIIEIITITGNEKSALARFMQTESERLGLGFFVRDALNVEQSDAVVLIGTRITPLGLNCAYCGFDTCAAMTENGNKVCSINMVDLGIALGSAVAKISDLRIDSRIMFSAGLSAKNMMLMPECQSVFAIPISISSKSPFFDRTAHKPAQ